MKLTQSIKSGQIFLTLYGTLDDKIQSMKVGQFERLKTKFARIFQLLDFYMLNLKMEIIS